MEAPSTSVSSVSPGMAFNSISACAGGLSGRLFHKDCRLQSEAVLCDWFDSHETVEGLIEPFVLPAGDCFLVLVPKRWDSGHFGLPVYELECFSANKKQISPPTEKFTAAIREMERRLQAQHDTPVLLAVSYTHLRAHET